eukprot:TRINITY_DN12975_c0_g2_i1.p2 TRINITY_DN12975_c0_g2~~TRINITY_DN12975_c0_g2_i1.p2  ORF type:complete len:147 (-),score=8.56 TRINITY_DN12975_c0_g2_i1:145-585(-)
MVFDAGNPILMAMMEEVVRGYVGNQWGNSNPRVITKIARTYDQFNQHMKIMPPSAFYPIHFDHIGDYFEVDMYENSEVGRTHFRQYLQIISSSYAFHYWNKISNGMMPHKNSLMYRIVNDYCLMCAKEVVKLNSTQMFLNQSNDDV